MNIVTDKDREAGCELCGKLGFHVTEADGWSLADIPLGKKQPREGACVVMRGDGTEKYASDRGAARAARNAGIHCSTQWPYYVSEAGCHTWRKMLGLKRVSLKSEKFDYPNEAA